MERQVDVRNAGTVGFCRACGALHGMSRATYTAAHVCANRASQSVGGLAGCADCGWLAARHAADCGDLRPFRLCGADLSGGVGGCLTEGPAGGFVGSCLGSVLTGFVFLEHLIWVR